MELWTWNNYRALKSPHASIGHEPGKAPLHLYLRSYADPGRALGDEIDISKEAQGLNPAETGCGRLGIDLKRTLQGAGRKQGKGGDGGGDGKRKRAKKQEGGDEENPINLGACMLVCVREACMGCVHVGCVCCVSAWCIRACLSACERSRSVHNSDDCLSAAPLPSVGGATV
eukprot:1158965-Pelagomonas_calceolata.AAC.2